MGYKTTLQPPTPHLTIIDPWKDLTELGALTDINPKLNRHVAWNFGFAEFYYRSSISMNTFSGV
jgi:hypothetical protein